MFVFYCSTVFVTILLVNLLRIGNYILLISCDGLMFNEGLTPEGVQMRRGFVQQFTFSTIPDLRPTLYSNYPATSKAINAGLNCVHVSSI